MRVINLMNDREVIVKVNDRGPFHPNRILDLSYAAAKKLDMIGTGTALVEVTALTPEEGRCLYPSNCIHPGHTKLFASGCFS